LAPGDSTVVELVFGTKTSKGKINKNARIMSNDSTRAAVTIDFAAFIVIAPDTSSLVRVVPDQLQFDSKTKKGSAMVENHSGTPIKLDMISKTRDDFKYKLDSKPLSGGDSRKLEFEWKGKTPEFDANGVFTFETGDMNVSRISLPFTIKGEKGPKPLPGHGSEPAKTTAKKMPAVANPSAKPLMGNQQGKTDSTKTINPIPGTPWPPK
jgi:hypothetical protein